jgi:hypothetical protein
MGATKIFFWRGDVIANLRLIKQFKLHLLMALEYPQKNLKKKLVCFLKFQVFQISVGEKD